MKGFAEAGRILRAGVEARAFPAASIEVGRTTGPLWSEAFGALSYESGAPATRIDTIFDLASLTKVIATTTLVMRAVADGRLGLDERVGDWFPAWRGGDREEVSVRDLLEHSAGLTAYLPLFRDHTGRAEFEHAICTLPLEYPPRERAVYSDLGFMLLGFLLQDLAERSGTSPAASSLEAQFADVARLVTSEPLAYKPARAWRPRTAPTEHEAWRGRLLVGEVHDENAWALGGAAGHAGLFGTAAAVGDFARAVLRTLRGGEVLAPVETARAFARRSAVPGSSRALGWDTMLPSSSCGTRLSPSAIGHTGFTGTSLWLDPEPDLYVVLLTNRVHPTRDNDAIRRIRPKVHDAVVEALG